MRQHGVASASAPVSPNPSGTIIDEHSERHIDDDHQLIIRVTSRVSIVSACRSRHRHCRAAATDTTRIQILATHPKICVPSMARRVPCFLQIDPRKYM